MADSELSINLSGQILGAASRLLTLQNSAFRSGQGLFETMRVTDGHIALADLHFERLNAGLGIIGLDGGVGLDAEKMLGEVLALCERNSHTASARVRLSVFSNPGQGSEAIQYLIETYPFDIQDAKRQHGLKVDIYPDGRKSIDRFSRLKSTNYLLYSRAADYAKKNALDDCFVLNSESRIAETSIANVFCIKGQSIYTPPLSEGSVAGVMRRWLLEQYEFPGYEIIETAIDPIFLDEADEIFLTNALRGVRPVRFFRNKEYGMMTGEKIALMVEDLLSGRKFTRDTVVGKK